MSFENIKLELLKTFPKSQVRFNNPGYLEISVDERDVSNSDAKEMLSAFCKKHNLPDINSSQISPSKESEQYHVGAMSVCDDEDYSLKVATCLYIMDKTQRKKRKV